MKLIEKIKDSIIENFVAIFMSSLIGGIVIYIQTTTNNFVNYLKTPVTMPMIWVILFGLGVSFLVLKEIKRFLTRVPCYKYFELEGYKWEVSPDFINGGFRYSVENLGVELYRFIKGPLCKKCMGECFVLQGDGYGETVSYLVQNCPGCGAICPKDKWDGSRFQITKSVYQQMQARFRKQASTTNIIKV